MAENQQEQLGKVLWSIANKLRGAMNIDDFRDYMLSFLFFHYISENYERVAREELGKDYPFFGVAEATVKTPLLRWYDNNPNDIKEFEEVMHSRMHYVINPQYLWSSIAELAKVQDEDLSRILKKGFDCVENESFEGAYQGIFSEINLESWQLGNHYTERNERLCKIISEIDKGMSELTIEQNMLGDAYEYLIGQFAVGGGRKTGEFYTPQNISRILSEIVTLDSHDPSLGKRNQLDCVLDFACGSGSLLLNVRHQLGSQGIGKIYGQESNITTYNLARMNMLLHGVKDPEFEIFHGDSLKNEWGMLREENPAKLKQFDAVVANPPFSFQWQPKEEYAEDPRFRGYGLAPKTVADYAFLLHGFHYLKDDGVMAIIFPYGVLFRGAVESKIRKKLLKDGNIDTVIAMPSNLFYSTGVPVCIIVLKKCKRTDDVLFINATRNYEKGKRKNFLRDEDVEKIVSTYQHRSEEKRFSRRVSLKSIIEKHDYNLNVSRYVSVAESEKEIDLLEVHKRLVDLEKEAAKARKEHNKFLKKLGLPELPGC